MGPPMAPLSALLPRFPARPAPWLGGDMLRLRAVLALRLPAGVVAGSEPRRPVAEAARFEAGVRSGGGETGDGGSGGGGSAFAALAAAVAVAAGFAGVAAGFAGVAAGFARAEGLGAVVTGRGAGSRRAVAGAVAGAGAGAGAGADTLGAVLRRAGAAFWGGGGGGAAATAAASSASRTRGKSRTVMYPERSLSPRAKALATVLLSRSVVRISGSHDCTKAANSLRDSACRAESGRFMTPKCVDRGESCQRQGRP